MKIRTDNPERRKGAIRWRLVLWLMGFLYAVPLVWMLLVSLKTRAEATASGFRLLPTIGPDGGYAWWSPAYWIGLAEQAWRNYAEVWSSPAADFPTYLRNSTIIALLSVIGMTISSSIAAYGFSRLRWRGRDAVFVLVLATLMIPPAVVIPSLYVLFKHLGWIGRSE